MDRSMELVANGQLSVILYVCPPQCPAGLVKMPKWLPAITLDLPMVLLPSTGKATLEIRLFSYYMPHNVFELKRQLLLCVVQVCKGCMALTAAIVQAGGGGGYPSAAAVGCKREFRLKIALRYQTQWTTLIPFVKLKYNTGSRVLVIHPLVLRN